MQTGSDIQGKFDVRKSLILPINSAHKILIQDRRGHKKPDWGYFGGGIEGIETPLEAVVRETKEELTLDLSEDDLIYLGASLTEWDSKKIIRYMYLYPTDKDTFDVREGKGGYWMTFDEAREHLDEKDLFDDVAKRIGEVFPK